MNRPNIKDFFSESTTVQDIQKAFARHPELYRYITALDAYVDWLEGKELEEEELPCDLIRDGSTYDCTKCGKSFPDFSERHYHKMNDGQRLQFFEYVQKCHGFDLKNEQCRHFFARFNPKNQYLVSLHFGDLVINENKNLPSDGIVVKTESDNL